MTQTIETVKENIWTEEAYIEWIRPYVQAMGQMMGRIEQLEKVMALSSEEPLHHVKSRIKTRESIAGKLIEKGLSVTAENAERYLKDIAGIRLVFYFESDLRRMAALLKQNSSHTLLKEKDYIECPKESGYRSLHLIFEVAVQRGRQLLLLPVEIQLRTVGMDFWAGMEHRLCYKRGGVRTAHRGRIMEDFAGCARLLAALERKIEKYARDSSADRAAGEGDIAILLSSCYNRSQESAQDKILHPQFAGKIKEGENSYVSGNRQISALRQGRHAE